MYSGGWMRVFVLSDISSFSGRILWFYCDANEIQQHLFLKKTT